MGLWLKQSTAITVKIGPFIDDTDGKTAEVALTLTQADIRLSKNGGNIAQKNEANNATTDELGYYDCPIDVTDTNTLGVLQLFVHESGALPVFHEYMVVPANVYDSLISGAASDYLDVSLVQIGGVAQSATDLKDFADTGYDPATHKVQGLVLCDTTTTNTDVTVLQADVGDASASTKGSLYGILGNPAVNNHTVTLENIHDTDLPDVHTDVGTALSYIDTEVAAILADTNELQTDWANGGRLDLLLDAAKEAVDTEVAAIKAITDTLTLNAIADAVLDEVVDANNPANANSFREVVNVMSATLAGKSTGGGTANIKFRDLGDTKDRVSATVTAVGDRTAVTNDGT